MIKRIVINLLLGIFIAFIYPKLLRLETEKEKYIMLIGALVILGLFFGEISFLFWFIALFLVIKMIDNEEYKYEDWKTSTALYVNFIMMLLTKEELIVSREQLLVTKTIISIIVLALTVWWLSEENNFAEYKNAFLILLSGLFLLSFASVFLSVLL